MAHVLSSPDSYFLDPQMPLIMNEARPFQVESYFYKLFFSLSFKTSFFVPGFFCLEEMHVLMSQNYSFQKMN